MVPIGDLFRITANEDLSDRTAYTYVNVIEIAHTYNCPVVRLEALFSNLPQIFSLFSKYFGREIHNVGDFGYFEKKGKVAQL